jgi:hypothetical protein
VVEVSDRAFGVSAVGEDLAEIGLAEVGKDTSIDAGFGERR